MDENIIQWLPRFAKMVDFHCFMVYSPGDQLVWDSLGILPFVDITI